MTNNRARRLKLRRRRPTSGAVIRFLRTEQIGGLILLGATALALIIANSPLADTYMRLSDTKIAGITLANWAKDGLLAIFFVVAGLELKRELVVGELRQPRQAALPIAGAIGGMVVPALVCLAVAWGSPGAADAWPVPVATDIAFALAVLAITARSLPASLRVFLLSLAIVDDLGAIVLIAILFSTKFAILPLLGAVAVVALYFFLQQRRVNAWWIYLLLGLATWVLVHESGIHATIAGVAIGLATRVKPDKGEQESPAEQLEHTLQPISAGICVPLFAFFAAGIPFSADKLASLFTDRAALGVLLGLVVGKTVGVLGGAFIAVRTRLAAVPEALDWRDLFAVSVLTGCGFTVSLLIAELAFPGSEQQDGIKGAVLLGSLTAALIAAALLRRRARAHAS
ncbi:Na+/H+ antiporter NhaA [Catelliglobosispora koreensis]|uniref:Na+/H+ antiporter NhaA n=1 Tax=Catelliglobosispora koreensis TaxID=129052 RepID=UPI000369AFF0|nr:Na+/H+ antiporter NhaA [Catelliglobosispora koreensis]